jgi:Mrp family chromosome partitioning ATPase
MPAALDAMRETHDLIILDTPAILANSDSLLMADLADGVIFVVRTGVTPVNYLSKAMDSLDQNRLRGVILNGERSSVPRWLRRVCGL